MKEKERERQALLSWLSWPVSFESFDVKQGVLVERGFSSSFFCATMWCSWFRENFPELIFNALI